MRLGGPVNPLSEGPEAWISILQEWGYRSAYCPVGHKAGDEEVAAYRAAAEKADIVIAEVGVWNNVLTDEEPARTDAITYAQKQLDLAERIGARCCVNIAGSRGIQWDGPHEENDSEDTFDKIVDTVREIIDAVKPTRTFYTLEPMPWIAPDSADSYLALIRAVDRPGFAVHLDMVNMVNSPSRYYHNADFTRECFKKLGPYIKSCHVKDILLSGNLTVHLDEKIPGDGGFCLHTLLREANRLHPDLPVMLEHLTNEDDYRKAAVHVRTVAESLSLAL